MISFAIVGNIASGKSTVENILQEKGYKVFDTDIIAHEVLNDFAEEIINQFDGHDISENGKVSREKLGKIVFNDKKLKEKLEYIVHPEIKNRIKSIFEKIRMKNMFLYQFRYFLKLDGAIYLIRYCL